MPRVLPPVWNRDQLEHERTRAVQFFVRRRLKEGDPDYLHHFAESEALVEELLSLTDDLGDFTKDAVVGRSDLIRDIARFTSGPPVSEDDFQTLLAANRIRIGTRTANAGALIIVKEMLDSRRFPWVRARRACTATERRAAVVATASLRAVERARTVRRGSEQRRQEEHVAKILGSVLTQATRVSNPDRDLPAGAFKRGVQFEGKQCDVLIRLFDDRFLAIECKSSNSEVNSIKRLNDVFEKQQVWRAERGAKVVTAAVVAGVFALRTLETAQEKGVSLFWEHDLEPLVRYIKRTKASR